MRILHVGFGFRPWIVNGLVIYCADLTSAQARAGHDVGYFFPGRQLPVIRRPFLHRWKQHGVSMFEWVNSTLVVGRHRGSPNPERDLVEPAIEGGFHRVLRRFRPEVVHIHDLGGLPSSLIDISRRERAATVMTMHDYVTLCPTVKLFDADQQICARRQPGTMCRVCCAGAPQDNREDLERTLWYARNRLRLGVPGLDSALRRPPLARLNAGAVNISNRLAVRAFGTATGAARDGAPAAQATATASAEAYQRRREVNLERLGQLDALILFSRRAAEVCRRLGVEDARMRVLRMNPGHVEHLRPRQRQAPGERLHFAVLNAANSTQKGCDLLVDALRELTRRGLDDRYRLSVYGWVAPHVEPTLDAHPAVRLRGSYSTEELDALLEDVDVGLVPSVWEEVYGFAGLEFLAKGIPVIGNAHGGIPEYVRPGATGWLNRSATALELADLMSASVEQPDEVRRLGQSAVALRSELIRPLHRQLDDLFQLYGDVLARRREGIPLGMSDQG